MRKIPLLLKFHLLILFPYTWTSLLLTQFLDVLVLL